MSASSQKNKDPAMFPAAHLNGMAGIVPVMNHFCRSSDPFPGFQWTPRQIICFSILSRDLFLLNKRPPLYRGGL